MNAPAQDITAIETKLAAARTKLILDKPFLGALVLRLPMIAANPDWCKTTATDARAFYFNPEFIESLDMSQTQFILAHEALHCALSHFHRRSHRIKHRWDLACDFAINPLLVDDGLTPPAEAVVYDDYRGMTAEEIYPLLDDNDMQETLDQHLYDDEDDDAGQGQKNDQKSPPKDESGKSDGSADDKSDDNQRDQQNSKDGNQSSQQQEDEDSQREPQSNSGDSQKSQQTPQPKPQEDSAGKKDSDAPQQEQKQGQQGQQGQTPKAGQNQGADKPAPLSQQEKENLSVQWQQRMAGAAQQAMQAGKFGGDMARMIDHMLQPRLPWRMLLADFMTASARDDFSYMRPSRREGEAILPSLRSSQIDMIVAVDTSGSIKKDEIEEFIAEIDAIKAQLRARIQLLACDSELAEEAPWTFESWDEVRFPEDLKGGGGTSFVPVFDWAQEQDKLPDLLVYFTDAEGKYPKYEPPFPVIWLVKGKHKTPWGRRIQLN